VPAADDSVERDLLALVEQGLVEVELGDDGAVPRFRPTMPGRVLVALPLPPPASAPAARDADPVGALVLRRELARVVAAVVAGAPLTREHLIAIFGAAPIYRLLTLPDETARQLLREAIDVVANPASPIDVPQWLRAAEGLVGPAHQHRRGPDGEWICGCRGGVYRTEV
jgi:hypothetical protein